MSFVISSSKSLHPLQILFKEIYNLLDFKNIKGRSFFLIPPPTYEDIYAVCDEFASSTRNTTVALSFFYEKLRVRIYSTINRKFLGGALFDEDFEETLSELMEMINWIVYRNLSETKDKQKIVKSRIKGLDLFDEIKRDGRISKSHIFT